MTPKIATCCYCGTRAALVLRGKERHELTCSNCGAPLHDLKMLKSEHPGKPGRVKPSPVRGYEPRAKPKKQKRKKRRKGFAHWAMEEVWDAIEDVFD